MASRPPFFLERGEEPGGRVWLSLYLPLREVDIPKLLGSPAPLGTEQLESDLPTPPGAQVHGELFLLNLTYRAKPERTSFLIRQLVEGMLATGWQVHPAWAPAPNSDGGKSKSTGVPELLSLELSRTTTGARVQLDREGGQVTLTYRQTLCPQR